MKVLLLASCRNPQLIRGTTLVFETIRTGFPTADIVVYGNGLHPLVAEAVSRCCDKVGARLIRIQNIRHDEWIKHTVWDEMQPYCISDTDMIYWQSVEGWKFEHPWAGRLQPEYLDPFSHTIHRQRLHTSLLFVRPDEVRDMMLRFDGQFPKAPVFPNMSGFFRQQLQPHRQGDTLRTYFMDTGATFYHACGGQAFTLEQLDAFSHLHAGTWCDLIGKGVPETHDAIYENPEIARGLWRRQEEFYAAHPPPV